jgi:hypothetical protein
MPDGSKTYILLTAGLLLLLGIIAGAAGFGLAALSEVQSSSVQLTATQLSGVSPETDIPPETPSSFITGTPTTAPLQTPRPTSTPQPTPKVLATISSPTTIIVRYGESLYPVCRRNCPGLWPLNDVPPSLLSYAQAVSHLNDIPWNSGHPLVYTGQRLTMPPCPQP